MSTPDATPSHDLLERFVDLAMAFDLCVSHRLHVPALILLYSAIDIAGWLDAADGEKSKASFTRWVDRYMNPGQLGCTALDLYGARCGVVHRFSSDSDPVAKGEAREVTYSWSPGRVEDLYTLLRWINRPGAVVVQVEDVWRAFCRGLVQFTEDLDADPARAAKVSARVPKLFSHMSVEKVSTLARLVRPPEPGPG